MLLVVFFVIGLLVNINVGHPASPGRAVATAASSTLGVTMAAPRFASAKHSAESMPARAGMSSMSMDSTAGGKGVGYAAASQSNSAAGGGGRMVARNAHISLEMEDVAAQRDAVSARVLKLGGFVVSSVARSAAAAPMMMGASASGETNEVDMTVRVPADQLDAFLESLRAEARAVLYESSHGEDVTEQYVDASARSKTLRATRDQLTKLLESATTVQDTLSVQRELGQITAQIEGEQARLMYLKKSTALATVTLQMRPPRPRRDSHFSASVARALATLTWAALTLVDGIIWMAVFSPLLLAAGLVGWAAWRSLTQGAPP